MSGEFIQPQQFESGKSALIAEGKTKKIWETEDPSMVVIQSKDTITAGDGAKSDILRGKAQLANQTTVNCFRLLRRYGIPNHFVEALYLDAFLAKKADMIPIEAVVRRVSTGSYARRHPETPEGTHLPNEVFEMFLKDDQNHDPLITFDGEKWSIPDPRLPTDPQLIDQLQDLALNTFWTLEEAWDWHRITLVDLKVEFGLDMAGKLLLADVIDNDSWRLWSQGHSDRRLDKDLYRQGSSLGTVLAAYKEVAVLTGDFKNIDLVELA